VSRTRDAIRLLVEHGALWKPDPSGIHDLRRILYKIEPQVTGRTRRTARPSQRVRQRLPVRLPADAADAGAPQFLRTTDGGLGLTLDGRRKSAVKETRPPTPSRYVLASYDREKLYKEVWAEPTQKVAARYGVSDVALAKACRQLQIPKPPRGYWAKKAARQPVPRQPKLLPLKT
jgi:hypothetical protein